MPLLIPTLQQQSKQLVQSFGLPRFTESLMVLAGKKNLIVAGVTTDVCLVPPALSMQAEGYHIKVRKASKKLLLMANKKQCVLDAGGSPTEMAEQVSWERLKQAGIPVTSTNAVVTELVKDWSLPAGQVAFPLLA